MKTCQKLSLKSFLFGVCACLNFSFPLTLLISMNVLFPDWLAYFQADRGATSAVQATLIGVTLGAGVIGGMLMHRLGDRRSLLLGTGLSFLGLLSGSYVPSLPTLVLCVGVVTGCGFCLLHLCTLSVALRRFPNRAGFLSCIMSAMAGLFHLVTPLMYRYLSEQFTWRGTLLTASALILHTAIFGLMLTSPLLQHSTSNTTTTTPTTTKLLPTSPSNTYICVDSEQPESACAVPLKLISQEEEEKKEEAAHLCASTMDDCSQESVTALLPTTLSSSNRRLNADNADTADEPSRTTSITDGVTSSGHTQDADPYPGPKVPKHAIRIDNVDFALDGELEIISDAGAADNHRRTRLGDEGSKELNSRTAGKEASSPDETLLGYPDSKISKGSSDLTAESPENEQASLLPPPPAAAAAAAAIVQTGDDKSKHTEGDIDVSQEKHSSNFDTETKQQQQKQRHRRTRHGDYDIDTERRRVSDTDTDTTSDITKHSTDRQTPSNRKTACEKLRAKTSFLCSPLYMSAMLNTVVALSAIFCFILLVFDFADHKGWRREDGILLNFVFMLCSLTSRALVGVVSLHARVRNTAVLIGSGVIGSVGLTLIGQTETVPLAVACYCLMGVCYGVTVGMFPAVILDVTGPKVYPLSLGLICTVEGVLDTAMGILTGVLVDKLQSYAIISLSYGLVSLATCILLLVVFLTCRR